MTLLAVLAMGGLPLLAVGAFVGLLKLSSDLRNANLQPRQGWTRKVIDVSPVFLLAWMYIVGEIRGAVLSDIFFASSLAVIVIHALDDLVRLQTTKRLRSGIKAA